MWALLVRGSILTENVITISTNALSESLDINTIMVSSSFL